jgi:hypothetical protein
MKRNCFTSLKYFLIFGFIWSIISCEKDSDDPVLLPVCDFNIQLISGNNQSGNAGENLIDSLTFRITDSFGESIPYIPVNFGVVAGGGSVSNTLAMSDGEGTVQVQWRIGSGMDQMMGAEITDEKGVSAKAYAIANSDITFSTSWIKGLVFYKNLSEPVSHDNIILETDHFLIFSNAASKDNKVIFAKISEEHFKNMADWYGLTPGDLGIHAENRGTKIRIYAHTSTTETGTWRGEKNSSIIFPSYGTGLWNRKVLAHEIAHMVELLIIKPENFVGLEIPVWFVEGIADYFADFPTAYPFPVDNLGSLDEWWSKYKNPLSIYSFDDMGSTHPATYYTMFGLVFKYLLDAGGLGISREQVLDFYHTLVENNNFDLSFDQNFGISMDDLRATLYERLVSYLPE